MPTDITPIRFLVEQYYDIQKLRIEAFNRIVAYCKRHQACETQSIFASQEEHEPHVGLASQPSSEIQAARANESKPEPEGNDGKFSKMAKEYIAGDLDAPKDLNDLIWYFNQLRATEKTLAKKLDEWSEDIPIRKEYLDKIQGIGPIFASAIIAWLSPIDRFTNISKLWSYCGLKPGQKRKKGEKLGYNPRIKTLMWKIAASFEKQKAVKSQYRAIYDVKKDFYAHRPDLANAVKSKEKGAKMHIRLMAMRYTAKHFLADLWLQWREMENLPITRPYAIEILGHSGFEVPEVDKTKEGV